MRRTRLAALFTALVLILSLAVPALAADDPAEQLTEYSNLNSPFAARIAYAGGKVFCIRHLPSEDEPTSPLAVLDTDFGAMFTVDARLFYFSIVAFDGAVYGLVRSPEDYSWAIVRVDPVTYAAETVWQPDPAMESTLTTITLLGLIGDRLYFDVYSRPEHEEVHTICRINSAGGMETCVRLDQEACDGYGIYLRFPSLTRDGFLFSLKDGGTGLFTPGMQLLRRYEPSDVLSTGSGSPYGYDQQFDLFQIDPATGASVNLSALFREQYGYTPIFRLGADVSAGSLYLTGLEEDGTLTVFRVDPDSLEAAVAGQVQIDYDHDAYREGSSVSIYLLENGNCLAAITTLNPEKPAATASSFQWKLIPLSAG